MSELKRILLFFFLVQKHENVFVGECRIFHARQKRLLRYAMKRRTLVSSDILSLLLPHPFRVQSFKT